MPVERRAFSQRIWRNGRETMPEVSIHPHVSLFQSFNPPRDSHPSSCSQLRALGWVQERIITSDQRAAPRHTAPHSTQERTPHWGLFYTLCVSLFLSHTYCTHTHILYTHILYTHTRIYSTHTVFVRISLLYVHLSPVSD